MNVLKLLTVCISVAALSVVALSVGLASPGSAQKDLVSQIPTKQRTLAQASSRDAIMQWFRSYDQIRRQAQMTPSERQQADSLLSGGMSVLAPGPDKDSAQQLLLKLTNNYKRAQDAMQNLPQLPETLRLHRGYYQYFKTAGELFSDYLTLQNNIFSKDPNTGQPLVASLMDRKQRLEQLNDLIQSLDQQTRAQYNIAPYRYQ